MQALWIVLLSLAVAVSAEPSSLIVGGVRAPDGKYPYQVQLRDSGRFLCGGSVVGKRYVLTAAHCVMNRVAKTMTILAGTNVLDGDDGHVYQADALIPHPKFGGIFIVINDVALIRVTEDIVFSNKVQPVMLPTNEYKDLSKAVTLTGWGKTSTKDPPSPNLLEIQLSVISKLKCKIFWWFVKDTHLCTLNGSGQGACNGDSGSPLVAEGNVQIGITSFGIPCARGAPDVFTKVHSFVDWINSVMNEK